MFSARLNSPTHSNKVQISHTTLQAQTDDSQMPKGMGGDRGDNVLMLGIDQHIAMKCVAVRK